VNLKLPTLKKPAGDEKTESKAPKFFSDLYRDLSDRHLLLPLVALLVGIVAVPMLLSSSSEPAVPPAPAADIADTSQLDAAVVVSNPGIRNYRERLDALKAKNPFQVPASSGKDGTATTTTSDSGDSGSAATPGGSTASTPSTGSTPSSSPSSTGSTSPPSVSVDTGSDTGGTTTTPSSDTTDTGGDTGSTPGDVKPETRFYASRVDVNVGPVGKAKEIDGVKQLDFLPDRKTPVVAYLGLVNDNSALFSVNPGVVETQGQGDCAPRGNTCMYLSLKVGQEQRFVYGDAEDATIYRLKLLDTRIVRVQDPRDRNADDGKGEKSQRTRAPVDASSRTN
jgi:hypothetical protein